MKPTLTKVVNAEETTPHFRLIRYFSFQAQKSGCFSSDLGQDVSAALSRVSLEEAKSVATSAPVVTTESRQRWEQGAPDYAGADAFDNILKKIDSTMSTPGSGEFLLLNLNRVC